MRTENRDQGRKALRVSCVSAPLHRDGDGHAVGATRRGHELGRDYVRNRTQAQHEAYAESVVKVPSEYTNPSHELTSTQCRET